jgi:hypothetical protein
LQVSHVVRLLPRVPAVTIEELAKQDPEAARLLALMPSWENGEALEAWQLEWDLVCQQAHYEDAREAELEERLRASRHGPFILDPRGYVVGIR